MGLDLILNELSIKRHGSQAEAKVTMSSFMKTVISLTKLGTQKVIRTKDGLNDILLADDYPITKWRNDVYVSQEERSFFRSLTSKSPYMVDSPELSEQSLGYNCIVDGRNADGFRATWVLGGVCLSFDTGDSWSQPSLKAELEYIDEEKMDICSKEVSIKHASNPAHASIHKAWIEDKNKLSDIKIDGYGLCRNFEYLVFCEPAVKLIQALSRNDPKFKQIIQKLDILNKLIKDSDGEFDSDKISFKFRNESDSTMQAFGEERTISSPDGSYKIYSWHFDINPGAFRGYVSFSEVEKKLYIGYLGKHLRIASQN